MAALEPPLLHERIGSRLQLTLNRPERANALNGEIVNRLTAAFRDPGDARMIVLTGAGERSFCAGADLKGDVAAAAEAFTGLLQAMDACRVPIVSRINGAAAGGGVGLICASDIAIAASHTTVATPEATLGLFPFMILPYIARVTTARVTAAMCLLGDTLHAQAALDAGIFSAVADNLDHAVDQTCASLARGGPVALATGRAHLTAALRGVTPPSAPAQAFVTAATGEEAREGLAAFRERRISAWAQNQ